ncbi:hypothetical protein F5Y15DRAFT_422172 [Xylariaceae sp. FL0016]|nr:hypothetical protein F5Y15DRAFT_422172 [Xylariaceae sp. FL0016]
MDLPQENRQEPASRAGFFGKLPRRIRVNIWRIALIQDSLARNVMLLQVSSAASTHGNFVVVRDPKLSSPLLHVNIESRAQALDHFDLKLSLWRCRWHYTNDDFTSQGIATRIDGAALYVSSKYDAFFPVGHVKQAAGLEESERRGIIKDPRRIYRNVLSSQQEPEIFGA